MLRPGDVARPAPARAFTTELAWAGSPQTPTSVMTGWFIVIYHRRTFTDWTGSRMGCEQRTQRQRTRGTWACSCGRPRLATRQTCVHTTSGESPAMVNDDEPSSHNRRGCLG